MYDVLFVRKAVLASAWLFACVVLNLCRFYFVQIFNPHWKIFWAHCWSDKQQWTRNKLLNWNETFFSQVHNYDGSQTKKTITRNRDGTETISEVTTFADGKQIAREIIKHVASGKTSTFSIVSKIFRSNQMHCYSPPPPIAKLKLISKSGWWESHKMSLLTFRDDNVDGHQRGQEWNWEKSSSRSTIPSNISIKMAWHIIRR